MALFNRKKSDSVLPEIDKYYDGERRDRTGLAWLLALVSVIAVTLLVVGVFLTGRWVYRALTDSDSDVAVVQNDNEDILPGFDGVEAPSDDEGQPQADEDSEDAEVAPDESPAEEEGIVQAPARTDIPSVPVTGDDPLPRTGPAGVAGVFIGISSTAGAAHYALTRKRK